MKNNISKFKVNVVFKDGSNLIMFAKNKKEAEKKANEFTLLRSDVAKTKIIERKFD